MANEQIQGVPPGLMAEPVRGVPSGVSAESVRGVPSGLTGESAQGVPPGLTAEPVQSQTAPPAAGPSFWDNTKHAIGQIFSATPEGAGSATSGAGAPELATQFKKDAEASEGPENKLTGAGVIVGGAKSAMEVPQTIGHFVAPNTFSAHPEALETKGTAETAGKIGENILEFMAGDAALKNLNLGAKFTKLGKIATLLEEHPVLAKAVEIGGNAIRTGAVGGGQTTLHGGTPEEVAASAAGGALTSGAIETAGELARPLARIFGLGGLTGEEAMVKAGRPSVTEDAKYRQALTTAAPRIAEAAKDAPLKTVGDFEDLLHNTAQDIRQKEFGPMIQRNAKQMVSAQPVAANIRAAITDQMKEYAPEEAKELEDFAVKFAKDMPLGKAESDLQYFNAQLKKFYKANAVDQNAALKTSGTVAKYEAAADGLRDLIYGRLRELGENAPEDLQQQYGALKTLERTFAKRATVADRQAPLNLPQVLSWAGGLTEAGGAILAGHPVAALAGAIPIAVSTAAKMRNAPESLIRQGVTALGKELTPQIGESLSSRAAKLGAGFAGAQAGRYVPILFSNGETREIHEEDVDKALKQNPGSKVAE